MSGVPSSIVIILFSTDPLLSIKTTNAFSLESLTNSICFKSFSVFGTTTIPAWLDIPDKEALASDSNSFGPL